MKSSEAMNRDPRPTASGVRPARLHRILPWALAAALMAGMASVPVLAQTANPPEYMTYQGYLVDANGAALASVNPVNYTVVFRIYSVSSGGSSLWTESQTVTVDKGSFSVVLGEGVVEGSEPRPTLSSIYASTSASDRYIGITVKGLSGGDPEILPRLRLLTSPYAFLAKSANGLVAADGTSLLVPDAGRLRLSQAIQSTGGNGRGTGAVDLQVTRNGSQPAQVASGSTSTLSGGQNNTASGENSVVAGGNGNTASGFNASALGGTASTASGSYATVAGGRQNTASGENSFAAGRRANAQHSGSFVWADNQDADYSSTANNQFMVRASGGVAINTSPDSDAALKVSGKIRSDSADIGTLNVTGTVSANALSGNGTVPLGVIVMWSGASVPTGWALCDGSTVNGRTTPDLRGRFVIGSNSSRSIGTVGGAENVTLTVNQIPSHNHSVSGTTGDNGNHQHSYTDSYFAEFQSGGNNNWWGSKSGYDGDNTPFNVSRWSDWAGNHNHTFNVTSGSTGGGQSVDKMPPFYALAFIMRVY